MEKKLLKGLIHVDPLFQLQPYRAADAVRGLVVPSMSEHCLRLTVKRVIEGDGFDYVHKVCTAALAQLSP